jgi:hypothetical protein
VAKENKKTNWCSWAALACAAVPSVPLIGLGIGCLVAEMICEAAWSWHVEARTMAIMCLVVPGIAACGAALAGARKWGTRAWRTLASVTVVWASVSLGAAIELTWWRGGDYYAQHLFGVCSVFGLPALGFFSPVLAAGAFKRGEDLRAIAAVSAVSGVCSLCVGFYWWAFFCEWW